MKIAYIDFRELAFDAVFTGKLPIGQFAFDGYVFAFGEEFFHAFGGFAPSHEAMPLHVGNLFTFLIGVDVVGGKGYLGAFSTVKSFHFCIAAEMANQSHAVTDGVHNTTSLVTQKISCLQLGRTGFGQELPLISFLALKEGHLSACKWRSFTHVLVRQRGRVAICGSKDEAEKGI